MRILYVADSFDIGGAERVMISDAIGLKAMGHDVTVACSSGGLLREAAMAGGVETIVCGTGTVKRKVSEAFARGLRGIDASFDIVHSHMYASHAAGYRAAPLGAARVLSEHSESTWRGLEHVEEARQFAAHASAIIAVSQRIADRLMRLDGAPSELVTTIRNAVPLLPHPSTTCPTIWKEGPTIGVVARLQLKKGVRTFVDAAASLSRKFPCARFVIAGDGPLRARLERLVLQLGLQKRLRFAGFVPDGQGLIGQLDVLVVPSTTEGTPLVVLEAMASGVAIVATRVGGVPEQVRYQREALLVERDDARAVAQACTRLLMDQELRSRLIVAARVRLNREFNAAHRLSRLEQLYRRVLASRPLAGVVPP